MTLVGVVPSDDIVGVEVAGINFGIMLVVEGKCFCNAVMVGVNAVVVVVGLLTVRFAGTVVTFAIDVFGAAIAVDAGADV